MWAQSPDPVEVRFDCYPAVETVESDTHSQVTRLQDNLFRFSVDDGIRNGDLRSDKRRAFELHGHGYKGHISLSAEQARHLQQSGQPLPVSSWEPISPGAALAAFSKRAAPFAIVASLVLGGCFSLWWRRRLRLLGLKSRQHRLDRLVRPGPDPLVGTVVGPYRLIDRLGAGGMARVYRAVPDQSLDDSQACALKIVRPERDSPEFRQRFLREIQVTMTLNHPNVIRVVDFGSQDEMEYLATELIEGVTLKEKIPAEGLGVSEALAYFFPLLDALEYAHGRGIVHRDLKPDNIMVTPQGVVKLMDFGLARNHEVAVLTVAGGVMGTPDYMAPEQLGERPAPNPLSDQYSAGLILYRLLCGRLPFDDQDTMALIYATVHEVPPPPTRFRSDLPKDIELVVMKSLEKEPKDRYPDLSALRQALTSCLQTGP